MVKAPLALESVGKNPTDRGKLGTKRSVLTDKNGLPLAVVLSGVNTHDVKLLGDTLDRLVVERPKTSERKPQKPLYGCGLYWPSRRGGIQKLHRAHPPSRGGKKMLEHDPGFRARRWVVEVVHSFMNRFRKLLVRCEKKAVNYLALVQFACAIIVWRNLIPVYR
mgnify:CR=1 FL=1